MPTVTSMYCRPEGVVTRSLPGWMGVRAGRSGGREVGARRWWGVREAPAAMRAAAEARGPYHGSPSSPAAQSASQSSFSSPSSTTLGTTASAGWALQRGRAGTESRRQFRVHESPPKGYRGCCAERSRRRCVRGALPSHPRQWSSCSCIPGQGQGGGEARHLLQEVSAGGGLRLGPAADHPGGRALGLGDSGLESLQGWEYRKAQHCELPCCTSLEDRSVAPHHTCDMQVCAIVPARKKLCVVEKSGLVSRCGCISSVSSGGEGELRGGTSLPLYLDTPPPARLTRNLAWPRRAVTA